MSRFRARVAVYVALVEDDRIFLQRRANTGYRDGEWAMPAGHVESGETPRDAAVRELREEAGVAADPDALDCAHALYRRCDENGASAYVDYLFICRRWTGTPIVAEPDKADAARWTKLGEFDDVIDFHVAMLTRALAGERFSAFDDF